MEQYKGLGSYVFTNSIQRSWRVAEALEYGLVGVNEGVISTEVNLIPCQMRLSRNKIFCWWIYLCVCDNAGGSIWWS